MKGHSLYIEELMNVMDLEGVLTQSDRVKALYYYESRGSLLPALRWLQRIEECQSSDPIDTKTYNSVLRDTAVLSLKNRMMSPALACIEKCKRPLDVLAYQMIATNMIKSVPSSNHLVPPDTSFLEELHERMRDFDAQRPKLRRKGIASRLAVDPKDPECILKLVLKLGTECIQQLQGMATRQEERATREDVMAVENTMLAAMEKFGRLDMVLTELSRIVPGTSAYNVLLKLLLRAGPNYLSVAQTVVDHMSAGTEKHKKQHWTCRPDVDTHALVLRSCVQAGNFRLAKKQWNCMKDILQTKRRIPQLPEWGVETALSQNRDAVRHLEHLLPEPPSFLLTIDPNSDLEKYELLIAQHVRNLPHFFGDQDEQDDFYSPASDGDFNFQDPSLIDPLQLSLDVFKILLSKGCRPRHRTFELLLDTCGLSDNLPAAKDIWRKMRLEHGIKPRARTYLSLMRAFIRCGEFLPDALGMIDAMAEDKIPFTVNIRRLFLRALVLQNQSYVHRYLMGAYDLLYYPCHERRLRDPATSANGKYIESAGQHKARIAYNRELGSRETTMFLQLVHRLQKDMNSKTRHAFIVTRTPHSPVG